jgi:two-component system, OmpR family, alkaline phosphatase synthesis response regulator PhoP
MKKVLLIEDDQHIIELLEIHLIDLHCQVHKANNGFMGLQKGLQEPFDLIVLDIMLPQMDGIEICKKLREARVTTPILMLTAKSEEIDRVLGLECGADDYLTKPFSVREFIARVKAIFRRMQMISENKPGNGQSFIHYKHLKIDIHNRKVLIKEERVELTPKEFDLLILLASHPGRSYSREQLLNMIWGYEFNGYEHTVNSHINRLRTKIELDLSNPEYILTTWGVGYRFSDCL